MIVTVFFTVHKQQQERLELGFEQCSPYQAVTGKIYRLEQQFLY